MTYILGREGPAGGAIIMERGYGILLLSTYYIPLLPKLPGRTYPKARGNQWYTLRQEAVGGETTRYPFWSWPKRKYELPHSFLRTLSYAELQALEDFFDQLNGGALPFYFDDVDDDTAVLQELSPNVGDGVTTQFQLGRQQITPGGFWCPIQSPVPASVVVQQNGTPVGGYTLGNAGLATFGVAPASGEVMTWSGSYYWLCSLDEDITQYQKDMYWLWSLKKLAFTTIKL